MPTLCFSPGLVQNINLHYQFINNKITFTIKICAWQCTFINTFNEIMVNENNHITKYTKEDTRKLLSLAEKNYLMKSILADLLNIQY